MSDARLLALEEKAAYFEKLAGDLDEVIQQLNQEVATLRRDFEQLRARVTAPAPEALDPDERPPHY